MSVGVLIIAHNEIGRQLAPRQLSKALKQASYEASNHDF